MSYSLHTYMILQSEKATRLRSTSHFMLLSWLQVLREVQVLACSGDQEPLVIYALTCPSLGL